MATALRVLAPIASQCVFIAPMSAMSHYSRTKSTNGASPVPYVMMAFNGILWMIYGAIQHPVDWSISAANLSAFLLGLYYIRTFVKYSPSDAVKRLRNLVKTSLLAFLLFVLPCIMILSASRAKLVLGSAGCAIAVIMFAGPLGAIKTVLRERNTKSLPVGFVFASIINCVLWILYGTLVKTDKFIWAPNALGLLAACLQLFLVIWFGICTTDSRLAERSRCCLCFSAGSHHHRLSQEISFLGTFSQIRKEQSIATRQRRWGCIRLCLLTILCIIVWEILAVAFLFGRYAQEVPTLGRIDVVYTWVNGTESTWLSDYARYRGSSPSGSYSSLFREMDQLRFSLRSLHQNFPTDTIGQIYILVANSKQVPSWLNTSSPGLKLITHQQLYGRTQEADHLPTFNSLSIESHLASVPGVSSWFLYMNDDLFLGTKVSMADFLYLRDAEEPVDAGNTFFSRYGLWLYQSDDSLMGPGSEYDPRNRSISYLANVKMHTMALLEKDSLVTRGDEKFPEYRREMRHVPVLINRDLFQQVKEKWPEEFRTTSASRFRSSRCIVPTYLYAKYLGAKNLVSNRNDLWQRWHVFYIAISSTRSISSLRFRFFRILVSFPKFWCLNDNLEDREEYREHNDLAVGIMKRFLEWWFPVPSPWELSQ